MKATLLYAGTALACMLAPAGASANDYYYYPNGAPVYPVSWPAAVYAAPTYAAQGHIEQVGLHHHHHHCNNERLAAHPWRHGSGGHFGGHYGGHFGGHYSGHFGGRFRGGMNTAGQEWYQAAPAAFPTHPYARGPRDFFMWRENMEEQTRRDMRPSFVP
ncbi:MAG: hypothetical protein L0Y72_16145 [Gemmataceae bacterium]|nr:hypothetical protein [Gemmataceae bacterium]MCI0740579.1 hypothetical protein [Gemmataceae bacterium]